MISADNHAAAEADLPLKPASAVNLRRSVIAQSLLVGCTLLTSSLAGCKGSQSTAAGEDPAIAIARQEAVDLFHFMLTLKYLEAEFYSRAALGISLPDNLLGRLGRRGDVVGPRLMNFTDAAIGAQMREIAFDKVAQVAAIHTILFPVPQNNSATDSTVTRPAIDLAGGQNGAFTQMARGAGIVGETESFDPYGSDDNFLLSSFFLSDLVVGLGKGIAGYIKQQVFLDAFVGILGCDSYHAMSVRLALYRNSSANPQLLQQVMGLSQLRDTLAGTRGDQGIVDAAHCPSLTPTDSAGLVLARSTAQALNILYLNRSSVEMGGFFPASINGNLRKSGPQ
jgi:hypothetical protein